MYSGRYVPPKRHNPNEALPLVRMRGGGKGFLDRYGNTWVRGETRTIGEDFEWDVQLATKWARQFNHCTRDGSHLNVSLEGRITHK
jgi:filamentous hemagglutinin